ncbi:hypothetical protein ACE3E6_000314 [Cronobacter sakazakii]|uniref:hypothetical protein n=1 Tax=Cronobacter sakazakii TaxID=28141 RepID=UPI000D3676D6|nr:hypothetical protein [Cronobacter sakazakii]ELY2640213.1 hypothetical protein [Cronobacter sakazakii]ELY4813785.1 hypothetical protein [Cronobacter sakazakii]PUE78084.1 hypothetical protein C3D71_06760 [Cronobacter sakazakii]
MHSENNELVRAGHELAKCLDNEPLIDIAKLLSKMATQLDVTTAALREKMKQCEQLAAENAKLADCANFYRLGFKPVRGNFGIEYRPTEQLLDDCGNTALEAIQTPATDAFLREVRAQGVEAYADSKYCQEESQSGAHEFAVELRQGGAA